MARSAQSTEPLSFPRLPSSFAGSTQATGDNSQAVGLIGGAALGAAIGGPVGAIVGGVIGAILGKDSKGLG
jgi:outer membrane lipoprotein SlyB